MTGQQCCDRSLIIVVLQNYFVAFSSFFIIANMKSAERRQRMMNTPQTDQSGRPAQRKPPTDTRKLPIAVATNHPPIIIPLSFGGATLDTNEIPIGERRSSAKVRMR